MQFLGICSPAFRNECKSRGDPEALRSECGEKYRCWSTSAIFQHGRWQIIHSIIPNFKVENKSMVFIKELKWLEQGFFVEKLIIFRRERDEANKKRYWNFIKLNTNFCLKNTLPIQSLEIICGERIIWESEVEGITEMRWWLKELLLTICSFFIQNRNNNEIKQYTV